MALNGGFEIPVEIIPQIKVQDNTSPQKFFTDLANKGTAAINDVARAAGQPITQEVRFEVKGGKLEAYVRNTSQLLRQMEGATNRAMANEKRQRMAQVREIERIRKAEFKRIAEVEKRANKARADELKKIQAAVREGQQLLEKERQVNIEIGKRKALRQAAMLPQKGSLAYAEQRLDLAKQRLRNMAQGTAAYKSQQDAVKKLTEQVRHLGGAGKKSGMAIVSGFLVAQAAMTALAATMNLFRASLDKIAERRKTMESLTVSFKAFGLTAEDAANSLEFTKDTSKTYGADLGNLDKTLRRITPTIVTMGGSMEDSQKLTQALAKRTAMLGLNSEQSGRYLEAFAQVMGKGKLQSEELNQQFSELDGALRGQVEQYLQANYGITNLNKAMDRGEVKAHMFANAFHAIVSNTKGLEKVKYNNFLEMVDQLERGEITLQQMDNTLDTLHTENLEKLGKLFKDSMVQLKGLQRAFIGLFDTDLMQNFFKGVKAGFDIVIFAGKGLVLLFFVIDDWMKQLKAKIKEVLGPFGWIVDKMDEGAASIGDAFKQAQKNVDAALAIFLDDVPKAMGTAAEGAVNLAGKMYEAAPAIESWAPALKKANDELKQLAANSYKNKEAEEAFEKGVTSFTQAVEDKIQTYKDLKKEVREKIKLEEIDAVEGEERIAQIDAEVKALKRKSSEMVAAAKKEAAAVKENTKVLADKAKQEAQAAASATTAANAQRDWSKSIGESVSTAGALIERTRNLAENYAKLASFNTSLGEGLGSTKDQMNMLNGSLESQQQEVEGLIKQYTIAAASGYKFSESEKTVLKSLQDTNKELQKQIDGYNRAKAARDGYTTTTSWGNVDQDIVNRVLSQQKKMWAVQSESGNWLIDWSKVSGSVVQVQRLALDLQNQMNELQKQRNKAEYESNELGDSQVNIQAQINQLLKGGNEERQKAVELQKKLANFSFQQRMGYNPADFAGARAAGGPVSGGSTYQVNELGREGFLSASGRLSEIKVPAFGSWKAPSSGEVIPAHVWSEIKAANSAVSVSASRLASSGASAMSSRRGGGGSVDNSRITNHVTIQSQTPVQTASELMVASAKRRRAKFRR